MLDRPYWCGSPEDFGHTLLVWFTGRRWTNLISLVHQRMLLTGCWTHFVGVVHQTILDTLYWCGLSEDVDTLFCWGLLEYVGHTVSMCLTRRSWTYLIGVVHKSLLDTLYWCSSPEDVRHTLVFVVHHRMYDTL